MLPGAARPIPALCATGRVLSVSVSAVPPLPPVARIPDDLPLTIAGKEPHTLPGWIGGAIYLALIVVFLHWVLPRL